MVERAPSGAYVEEWRLVPGSRSPLCVTQIGDEMIYRAGDVAVLVRDRAIDIPRLARLPELMDEYAQDRAMMEALLDCEFSVAERTGEVWVDHRVHAAVAGRDGARCRVGPNRSGPN